jgi:uncharacterized protein YodC (DUF2158 family)
MSFGKGDLVKLKSGGPTMTVDRCAGEESSYSKLTWGGVTRLKWNGYRCVWFDGHELKSEVFDGHLLVAATKNPDKSGEQ